MKRIAGALFVAATLFPLLPLLSLGCASRERAEPAGVTTTSAAQQRLSAPAGTLEIPSPRPPGAILAVRFERIGLARPVAVIHDRSADRYLVSNAGRGTPGAGFVSRLYPDGKVDVLKWLGAGQGGALRSPNGLAVGGDILYVADVDAVAKFDRATGAPLGRIGIPGAVALTDVAIAPDGRVLVLDRGKSAVFAISPVGAVSTIAEGKDLGGPEAAFVGSEVWIAAADGRIYTLDPSSGRRSKDQKLPLPSLSGISADEHDLIVSSSAGGVVMRGKSGGRFEPIIDRVVTPGDIGFDAQRRRLLVPFEEANSVDSYELYVP